MKKHIRDILRLILIGVFLVSTFLLVRQYLDDTGGEKSYQEALTLATRESVPEIQTEPVIPETAAAETAPAPTEPSYVWIPAPIEEDENLAKLQSIDVTALQERNPDVLGWICIPDSKINYPLLQGEDNEYYLKHTWEGASNTIGSIFLECQNSPDMTDFNTIVYGHNMRSGAMFADVSKFGGQWFFDNHPYIYILLPGEILRYEVFSAYQAPIDGPAYGLSFNQRETREKFLSYALESSVVTSEVQPEITDRIVTLSTCTGSGYDKRWVVHGVLHMIRVEK